MRLTIIKTIKYPSNYQVEMYEYNGLYHVRLVDGASNTLQLGRYLTFEAASDAFDIVNNEVKEYI